jgi:chorismate mutase / prephenate dehydratase
MSTETASDRLLDPFELPPHDAALADLRGRIDGIDRRLLALLHDRAQLAAAIGELKRAEGLPTLAAAREREVIERAREQLGAMPAHVIEDVFSVVVAACRRLQTRPRVACLGPAGSFSHAAALARFGSTAELAACDTLAEAVARVARAEVDAAIVPCHGSRVGRVVETHDAVRRAAARVRIASEFREPVRYLLLGKGPLDRIVAVHSRPEVLSTCEPWLHRTLPHAQRIPTPSTSAAARHVAELEHEGHAAIASSLAAQTWELSTLASIADDATTTFWVLIPARAGESP